MSYLILSLSELNTDLIILLGFKGRRIMKLDLNYG